MKDRNQQIVMLALFIFIFSALSSGECLRGKDEKPKIIPRESWNAKPPRHSLKKLSSRPVSTVIISETRTQSCSDSMKCAEILRNLQESDINDRRLADIAYNFLVAEDGTIYVGRDWTQANARIHGFYNQSIAISFIGTFDKVSPSEKQLEAAGKLIQLGVDSKKIKKDYLVYAESEITGNIERSGDALIKAAMQFPHWSEDPLNTVIYDESPDLKKLGIWIE